MTRRGLLWLVLAAASSCVLADTDIEFVEDAISNRNPVRLVEATMLSEEAEEACDPDPDDKVIIRCPQPGVDPSDVHPHFLDPEFEIKNSVESDADPERPYTFCTCTPPRVDSARLSLTLFVEDEDEEPRTRDPKDKIYAALLLDMPKGATEPYKYVDYENYLDPESPLPMFTDAYKPPRRRDPRLRVLDLGVDVFGRERGVDLCTGGRRRLSVGYHSLTVMVTDRRWFLPRGSQGRRHIGVPDIANGATFDTMTYVFRCAGESEEDDPSNCAQRCESPDQENL